jgi:signal transduction histidine kinase
LEGVARLAFALRPSALDEFGLVSALKGLVDALEHQGGPNVAFDADLPPDVRLPSRVETVVFRITQEALTNVVKHAEANAAHVTLSRRKRSVVLIVEDDGHGFSQAQVRAGGFGLVGMRERVASVDGAIEIESGCGDGTRLTVEIPVTWAGIG